jgi:hypothetical protein
MSGAEPAPVDNSDYTANRILQFFSDLLFITFSIDLFKNKSISRNFCKKRWLLRFFLILRKLNKSTWEINIIKFYNTQFDAAWSTLFNGENRSSLSEYTEKRFLYAFYKELQCHSHYFWTALSTSPQWHNPIIVYIYLFNWWSN